MIEPTVLAVTFAVVASTFQYATLGAVWNLGNVSFKKLTTDGEKMVWRRLAQAVVLGGAAGVLVGLWGEPADPGMFEVAMATVVPLADKAYNAFNAGVETYHEADDGDDEHVDEVRLAAREAVAELIASGAEVPNLDGPQQTADDVDPETGAPIDMAHDEEPDVELAERERADSRPRHPPADGSEESSDTDTVVRYGP